MQSCASCTHLIACTNDGKGDPAVVPSLTGADGKPRKKRSFRKRVSSGIKRTLAPFKSIKSTTGSKETAIPAVSADAPAPVSH